MQICSDTTIAGLPILEVRRFLRETMHSSCWYKPWLDETLHLPKAASRKVLAQLAKEGFIERSPEYDGGWRNTIKGNALASASAAKPLHRRSAERRLAEFLDRVRLVNSPNSEFLYLVEEVALFGSMLTEKARLSDVDLSVRLERRLSGDAFSKAATHRTNLALRAGRAFRNITEEIYWPEREVKLFLKNRSRAISLVEWDAKWLATQSHKIIYRRLTLGK